jgi:hypothetical protein
MSFQDYKKINKLINDIIGLDTKQGQNLSLAVKNYFDTKPVNVKLISKNNMSFDINSIQEYTIQADRAMKKYTEKLKKETAILKENGEFCSIDG